MAISKRTVLTAGAGFIVGMSTVAVAQAQNKKSSEITSVGEGEAVMLGSKGDRVHKSNSKITAAQHEAAMKKGAREIKPGAVIYRQGGKIYMLEEPQTQTFHDVFEDF